MMFAPRYLATCAEVDKLEQSKAAGDVPSTSARCTPLGTPRQEILRNCHYGCFKALYNGDRHTEVECQ